MFSAPGQYIEAMLTEETLREWITGMQAGRQEAFEAFLGQFTCSVTRVAARFVRSEADREEWTELVLLHAVDRILEGRLSLGSVQSFNAWLLCLAGRKCIELWRREKLRRSREGGLERLTGMPDAGADQPSADMEREEIRSAVIDALCRISKSDHRRTLELMWQHGWSAEEVALKFGRPVNTIRTWERRGRLEMREILQRTHPEIAEEFD